MKEVKCHATKESQHNAKTLADILALLHTNHQGGKYLDNYEQHVPSDTQAKHLDQTPQKMLLK